MPLTPINPRTHPTARTLAVLVATAFLTAPTAATAAGGDFNGDGFADAAIGIRLGSAGGASAGAVQVIYGGPRGLRVAGNQRFHQGTPGVPDHPEDEDLFGYSLATGDLDGNGFDELAIGAFRERNAASNTGAVHVLYGSRRGLRARGSLLLHQGSLGGSEGADPVGHFGRGLAIGNFGRGPRDDLAVGDYAEKLIVDGVEYGSAGAVSIFYGTRRGLVEQRRMLTQATPGIAGEVANADGFGDRLAAGNVGYSRLDDLIVGSPEAQNPQFGAGSVNVIYAGRNGLPGPPGPEIDQMDLGQAPEGDEDRFGAELAVGNLGRGAYADIAIGSPGERYGDDDTWRGRIDVLFGGPEGVVSDRHQPIDPTSSERSVGGFGMALAIANLQRGGPRELAVGVPAREGGAAAYVYESSPTGVVPRFSVWRRGGRLQAGSGDDSGFGEAIAAANFGRTRLADLVVGADGDSGGGVVRAGSIHAIYSDRSGLSGRGDRIFTQATPGILGRPGGLFGYPIAP